MAVVARGPDGLGGARGSLGIRPARTQRRARSFGGSWVEVRPKPKGLESRRRGLLRYLLACGTRSRGVREVVEPSPPARSVSSPPSSRGVPAKPIQHRPLFPKRPGRPRKDPLDRCGHHGRPGLDPRVPLLITQKFVAGTPYARTMEHLVVFEDVLLRKQDPAGPRVVEYSLQGNQYHLIVEVPGGREGLARGMRSFHGTLAKSWNQLSGRRSGMFASNDEAPLGNARPLERGLDHAHGPQSRALGASVQRGDLRPAGGHAPLPPAAVPPAPEPTR
jgi:hypothetical protein